ncbi:hypothetical protein [Amycolatopsis sp.]|jgi:hypothetical protein|uniref:hypothetical protein n=1 Tax=Amycolatopsis sp. TaxID=37632 RepID=UPI002E0C4F75|nr:hypothetical protein [Amycolatopsis sp.]
MALISTHRQPHEFTWWLLLYVALAVGTQLVGWSVHRHRHRTLPPGYYGTPAAPIATSPPFDWAPRSA